MALIPLWYIGMGAAGVALTPPVRVYWLVPLTLVRESETRVPMYESRIL